MYTVKLPTPEGQHLAAQMPVSWAEVPFRAYVNLRAVARPTPASLTQLPMFAYGSVAGCEAVATFVGLPTAEPLHADVRHLLRVYRGAPWLFDDELPDASTLATCFTHQGTRYRYAPDAELGPEAAAARRRVLLGHLREADCNMITCGPHLLAALYTPKGRLLTVASEQAGRVAFETLPLSIAWPALLHFVVPNCEGAPIQRYLALRPMLEQALAAFEAAAPPPRRGLRAWLGSRWPWARR